MLSTVLSILVFHTCGVLITTTWADDCFSYQDDSGTYHDSRQCSSMHCCGTCNNRYCCPEKTRLLTQELCNVMPRFEKHTSSVIILGSILGAVIPIIFCVGLITCFVAPCCFLYKKCRKRRDSHRRQNVTSTFVVAPHQPATTPHQPPFQPGYQPVPVPPHYGGPAMPSAPMGPPPYTEEAPPAYPPGVLPSDQHTQPPYNPSYGFHN
nr:protein shisa-5-like [Nerophis lumbriciformis]